MKTWTIAGALIAAGAMLASSAFAQTTTPGGAQQDKAKSGTESSGAAKTDTMKSDSAAKSGRSSRMAGGKREQVKAAQQALKDKGHDPGAVDGVMGPKTQAAVKDFQSKEGLKTTGQLDGETLSKLGVQARAGASADTGSTSPSASPSAAGSSGTSTGSSGTK